MRSNLAALLWNCVALRGISPANEASPDYLISPESNVHDLHMFYGADTFGLAAAKAVGEFNKY